MYVLHHLWYASLSIYVHTTSEVLSATSQPSLLILASQSYIPPSHAQALLPHTPPNFTMSIVSLGYPGKNSFSQELVICQTMQ